MRPTTPRVTRNRDAIIRRRLLRVHNPSAIGSPARLTTLSIIVSLAI
jgi:hypothetical protein